MPLVATVFVLLARQDLGATLDALAVKRDFASVEAVAAPELKGKFGFLRAPGAYGTGSKGWHAGILRDADGKSEFAVFYTPLTTQDYGDQVFEVRDGKLVRQVHERDTRGVRIRHLDMDLKFDLAGKATTVSCKAKFEKSHEAEGSFFVRLGENYRVAKVTGEDGKPRPFRQVGGVVSLPTMDKASWTYTLAYSGVVDRPRFAGVIRDNEVLLTNDYWWPSIGRLPVSFTTKSTVPAAWTVVAQGELVSEVLARPNKEVTFRMDLPVSYLSYSAGPFAHAEKKVGRITYHAWSSKLGTEQLKDQVEFMPPIIEFFDRIVPYPFTRFGAMDTPLYVGGALEAYSYATYGSGWLPDEDAHEPSHTWFGGIAPNTYLETYWNESFAAFCEGLYAREGAIGNVGEKQRAFVSDASAQPSYKQAAIEGTGADAGGLASDYGYGKGADVLQQLEYEMGTNRMMEVMRQWLTRRIPGEQQNWKHFETSCGPEWKGFFDQWLRRPGWPEFKVSGLAWANGQATFNVEFTGPTYRLLVETLVRTSKGDKYERVVIAPKPGESTCKAVVPCAEAPILVSLDPFDRLLAPRRLPVPASWAGLSRTAKVFIEPGREKWFESKKKLDTLPADLNGVIVVGHPESLKAMAPLCAKAGFVVKGDKLTYKGTTVDLKTATAVAVVPLEAGGRCGIYLGQAKYEPKVGKAGTALCDDYGRFLRGETPPRVEGALVLNVP